MSDAKSLGYPEDDDTETERKDELEFEVAAAEKQAPRVDDEPGQQDAARPRFAVIPTNDQGLITPQDSEQEFRFARMLLDTRSVPSCFETPQQVVLGVQMCRALGVNPALGMRQVMVIPRHNTLAVWGELPKAACQKHIEFFEEVRFDEEYTPITFANKNLHKPVFGVVAHVKRRGYDQVYESYFTLIGAAAAGLTDCKPGTPWRTYPDRMLQMRARSRLLKDVFPDVLSGVAIAEYDYNILDGRGEPMLAGPDNTQMLVDKLNEGLDSM